MDERLADLQRKVGMTRRRIEDASRRLAAVRDRLRERGESPGDTGRDAGAPLFAGLWSSVGGLDDLELHFEALGDEQEDEGEDPTTEEP
jgi:hypothetical protein